MSNSKDSRQTFKVGDKVVPFPTEDGYLNGYLVAGSTYTVTKIHENGRVDLEGKFKYGRDGENWDSDWFKFYEEKEVKAEKTCKFKVGDVVVCTETDRDVLESNLLGQGQSYIVNGIVEYDEFEGNFLLKVQNIETQKTTYAYEYRFNQKKETSLTAESLRNSILSLQQERVSLQDQIEQNIAQEKALVEQLKEMGFSLVEQEPPSSVKAVDEKKAVLYAEDIEEDMTDPLNLQVGDVLECLSTKLYPSGTLATVSKVDGDTIHRKVQGEKYAGNFNFESFGEIWKFHSRPVVN